MNIRYENHQNPPSRTRTLRGYIASVFLIGAIASPAFAEQVDSTETVSRPALASAEAALNPGDYRWYPDAAPAGQLLIVVSIPEQLAHVYRAGVRIGISTVSTGTDSHPTPTGTFEILQKKVMNHSNLYNNAPMPFMQRLTWDGIALHAGKIPGYPASHGCIRLPLAFAEKLYSETSRGMLVVIADQNSHDPHVVYPGDVAPVDTYSGSPLASRGEVDRSVASAAP